MNAADHARSGTRAADDRVRPKVIDSITPHIPYRRTR
jgi:hypothetical protein